MANPTSVERLREGVRLSSDLSHELILELTKDPSPAQSFPAAIFAFDSSFPGPGVFKYLEQIQRRAQDSSSAELVVFGHADQQGSNDYNKRLSDRRAKAVLALLTNDRGLFTQLADSDRWGVSQYQAMLRGIGCNPGNIDGSIGPETSSAVTAFQREYNENVYHDEVSLSRIEGNLIINGNLDRATKAAILDAYVVGTPGNLDANRFRGPKFAGCGEFNPASTDNEENRRVVVAFVEKLLPKSSQFPCVESMASACPVDNKARQRCKFYRRFITEDDSEPCPDFFDFQWLRLQGGNAHLSALTTLPDGTPAEFIIYRPEAPIGRPAPQSFRGDERPGAGPELARIVGRVAGGVCFAEWAPPSDFDPFDLVAWLNENDGDPRVLEGEDASSSAETIDGIIGMRGFQPPVFCIESSSRWGFSKPPGRRLNRIRFVDKSDAVGLAVSSEGSVVRFSAADSKVRVDDELEIVTVAISNHSVSMAQT